MSCLGSWNGWPSIRKGAGSFRARGGLRKLRWAAKGHGKRGGVRVIYFWWMTDDRILLLDIHAKGEQEDLAAAEIAKLRRKVIR